MTIDILKNQSGMIPRAIAIGLPFSTRLGVIAKPINIELFFDDSVMDYSDDGESDELIKFKEPTYYKIVCVHGLKEFDMRVLLAVSKMVNDVLKKDYVEYTYAKTVDRKHGKIITYNFNLNLHAIAKYLDNRNKSRLEHRKMIVASLIKLRYFEMMWITKDEHKDLIKIDEELEDDDIYYNNYEYIFGKKIKADDNYDYVKLDISCQYMETVKNGIVFNLEQSLKFKGNAFKFYLFLQTKKRVAKGANKFGYWKYIAHDEIVKAMQFENLELKKQKFNIKKLFANVGQNYIYKRSLSKTFNWVSTKK